jgi:GNAT superfamily N-acetyltransferase
VAEPSPVRGVRPLMYLIGEASPADVGAVAAQLRAYMLETYHEEWRGTVEGLLRDVFGARIRVLIALRAEGTVGFLAWERAYDLHHCLTGGHILDLYVSPRHRARGIAVQLIARAAGIVHSEGGAFIKGGAVESGSGSRLYARFAPAFGNDYILGGKAFRHVAAQSSLPMKALVRSMPQREWNFEP